MMKWLRAHTKQIMVVVVLLAMLSFVGGSALVEILAPDPAKSVFGKAFGQDITQGDLSFARQDVEVLDRLSPVQSPYPQIWQFGNKATRLEHWYLLYLEAERAGVEVSDQEIERDLKALPAEYLENLRVNQRITPPAIRQALRRQMAIQKHASHVTGAAMPSEGQVKHFVSETEDKIRVKFISVPAERYLDNDAPISDAEVQAMFDAHKDEKASESDSGFGYKYDDRVKLQYISTSLSKISPQVTISMDAIKTYWKANKAQFTKTIYVEPETPASQPTSDAASQPAEPPAPQPKQVEKSFSEAREDVERELRRRNATQLAEQAMKKAQSLLAKPWQDVKTDTTTGLKPIPAGADAADVMKKVADRIMGEFGVPVDYAESEWLSKDDLMSYKDLRGAFLSGQLTVTLSDYAFNVPPFYEHDEDRSSDTGLQLFQPCEAPFTAMSPQFSGGQLNYATDRYIVFRVVATTKSQAPADVSEVRDQVERDVRIQRGFAKAEPVARELYAVASRLGVEKTLDYFPDLKSGTPLIAVTTPPSFARRTRIADGQMMDAMKEGKPTLMAPSVTGVGLSETFVDACYEMTEPSWSPPAMDVPETERTAAATTQPALEPAPLVRLLSIPKLRKHFVVELAGTEPVDQEKFETTLRNSAYFRLLSERRALLMTEWFDPKAVEERAGFERVSDADAPDSTGGIEAPRPPQPPMF